MYELLYNIDFLLWQCIGIILLEKSRRHYKSSRLCCLKRIIIIRHEFRRVLHTKSSWFAVQIVSVSINVFVLISR